MGTLKKGQTMIYKTFLRKSNKRSSNTNLTKKFENTKGVIRSRKLKKDRQFNGNIKKDKGQTMVYKSLHIQLKVEKHEHH
jgi:hypothetical protein